MSFRTRGTQVLPISPFSLCRFGLTFPREFNRTDDAIGKAGQSGITRTRQADDGGEKQLPVRHG
jgi:hypothetical protein